MRQPKQRQLASLISLNKLSARSQTIKSLIKQAETRTSLEEVLNDALPPAFKNKFQIISTDKGILTLSCQSASLMTKFRFSLDKVLQDLNQRIRPRHISNIKIKVRPNYLNQDTVKRPQKASANKLQNNQKSISKKNAQILIEEAEHTHDKKLREVLLRLAEHSQQSNT